VTLAQNHVTVKCC